MPRDIADDAEAEPLGVGPGTALLAAYVAAIVATVAAGVLALNGYGGNYVLAAAFDRPRTFVAVVLGASAVVGIAAWSSSTQGGAARRALAAGIVLSVLALAWIPLRTGPLLPSFDGDRFRAAVRAGDGPAILRQAELLVVEDQLPGLPEAALVRRLGPPDVRGRRWWQWGVTSEGGLRVRVDRGGLARRVAVVGRDPG